MRTAALRTGALALLAAQLGGCGGLLHSNAQPEQTYYLRAPAADTAPAAPVANPDALAVSLRVGHPSADPGLDSPHIMLVQRRSPHGLLRRQPLGRRRCRTWSRR